MTLTADREEQNDELLALSGILDQAAFSHSESQSGENKGVIEESGRERLRGSCVSRKYYA